MKPECVCGHSRAIHRRPIWLWRVIGSWSYVPLTRLRVSFACADVVWNGSRSIRADCVCIGYRPRLPRPSHYAAPTKEGDRG